MKFRAAFIIPALIAFGTVAAARTDKRKDKDCPQQVERTIATDARVLVSLCLVSGDITVHGWDRNEVRARSNDASQIELRRRGTATESSPATKLDVLITDQADGLARPDSCQAFSDLQLDVPRGATVQLQTRDGDVSVVDVATAYVNTQSGDISVQQISRAVDAGSIGGDISLKDSNGRVNLHSISGSVEAINVRFADSGDAFEASSVSGDITLERVTHTQLNAHTVSGTLNMSGPLAHGGRYGFKTLSGDVTLTLPADASFQLSAKISQNGEIITDFPLTLMTVTSGSNAAPPAPPAETGPKTPAPPKPGPRPALLAAYGLRRINAVHGGGDATIYLASFSGTLHLRKK